MWICYCIDSSQHHGTFWADPKALNPKKSTKERDCEKVLEEKNQEQVVAKNDHELGFKS